MLENRFPVWDPARGAPDGIIVLGGAINPRALARARRRSRSPTRPSASRSSPSSRATIRRRASYFPAATPACLGKGPRRRDYLLSAARKLRRCRATASCSRTRSRNTAENAAFTKALVEPKPGERWLLVTSAQHMPRAIGCFRRAGFPVEAYPVDWHSTAALALRCCRPSIGRGARDGRRRRARMGRAHRLLADRAHERAAAGAVRRSALARLAAEHVVDGADDDARFLAGETVVDRLAVAARRDQPSPRSRASCCDTVGWRSDRISSSSLTDFSPSARMHKIISRLSCASAFRKSVARCALPDIRSTSCLRSRLSVA